jgi:hypothetical protein
MIATYPEINGNTVATSVVMIKQMNHMRSRKISFLFSKNIDGYFERWKTKKMLIVFNIKWFFLFCLKPLIFQLYTLKKKIKACKLYASSFSKYI